MSDWESYWKNISKTGEDGQVFWDTVADQAASQDFARFQPFMDQSLPILDLGCGNGRQTRFLANHFPLAIGADISASAIQLAVNESTDVPNIEFRVFNAVNESEARSLHDEFGDINIYMRGVFHMIPWKDRQSFVASLSHLLGEKGVLFQIELSSESILRLRELPTDVFEQIPKVTKRVGFNLDERHRWYSSEDWIELEIGNEAEIRSIRLPNGSIDAMPGNYMILKPRTAIQEHTP